MDALMQWSWPGNVRELENFVDRSVILTHGSVLAAPLGELAAEETVPRRTLELVEREHILQVLKDSRGKLSGPSGSRSPFGFASYDPAVEARSSESTIESIAPDSLPCRLLAIKDSPGKKCHNEPQRASFIDEGPDLCLGFERGDF